MPDTDNQLVKGVFSLDLWLDVGFWTTCVCSLLMSFEINICHLIIKHQISTNN